MGVHEVKYLPPTKVTYTHTGFQNGQASYFNMKVFVFADLVYAEAGDTHFLKPC